MSKSGYIHLTLSLLLTVYLVAALWYTKAASNADTFRSLQINIVDSVSRGFVTSEAIDNELGGLSERISHTRRDSINTLDIERRIMSMDKIESARCVVLNDGSLRIYVTPLLPVARVFDTKGDNYYINRAGKSMAPSHRYRIDVPVIVGDFNPNRTPAVCFPLLDFLAEHPDLADVYNTIEIKKNRDIILIPSIKGHVVNLGDCNDLENKFDRIGVFYRKVMPHKGWTYYDTISVKWRGQIVAHQLKEKARDNEILVEEHDDIDDISTMSGGFAPPPPKVTRPAREKPDTAKTSAAGSKKPSDKPAKAETPKENKKSDTKR